MFLLPFLKALRQKKEFVLLKDDRLVDLIKQLYDNYKPRIKKVNKGCTFINKIDKYKFLSLSSKGEMPLLDGEIRINIDKKSNIVGSISICKKDSTILLWKIDESTLPQPNVKAVDATGAFRVDLDYEAADSLSGILSALRTNISSHLYGSDGKGATGCWSTARTDHPKNNPCLWVNEYVATDYASNSSTLSLQRKSSNTKRRACL